MLYTDLIWQGRPASELGVIVTGPVSYQRPARRVESVVIPGRSGTLTIDQGEAWEEVVYAPDCAIRPGFSRDAVFAWLQGRGRVCFGSMPDYAFDARLSDAWTTSEPTPGHPGGYVLFTPVFVCQPWRYEAIPAPPHPLDGTQRLNPGNVPAAPLIRLTASPGAVVRLTAGGRTLTVTAPVGGGDIRGSEATKLDKGGQRPTEGMQAQREGESPTSDSQLQIGGAYPAQANAWDGRKLACAPTPSTGECLGWAIEDSAGTAIPQGATRDAALCRGAGEIIVDCEAEAAYGGGQRCATSGSFPVIPPGRQAVTMAVQSGTVSSATVEPRYRWL